MYNYCKHVRLWPHVFAAILLCYLHFILDGLCVLVLSTNRTRNGPKVFVPQRHFFFVILFFVVFFLFLCFLADEVALFAFGLFLEWNCVGRGHLIIIGFQWFVFMVFTNVKDQFKILWAHGMQNTRSLSTHKLGLTNFVRFRISSLVCMNNNS